LERRAHTRRRIPLLLSRELMEPGIFGIFRPVLLWPERPSERLEDEHIEAILTHELMHARRHDNLAAALHMLVEAAFWFHPLIWWIEGRMVEERERACDEAVVQMGGRPDAYAESLLKACRFCIESPLACVSGITGADLNRRIVSIVTLRLERLSLSKKLALGTLGFIAILGPVAFGVMQMLPVYSQILHATGPRPAFEVATIKPSKPDETPYTMISPAGHYTAKHISLRVLVQSAYLIRLDDQPLGGPSWMDREFFDIEA
jgi:beta-lactamase regulating signal transducer with metallopeptidase domain